MHDSAPADFYVNVESFLKYIFVFLNNGLDVVVNCLASLLATGLLPTEVFEINATIHKYDYMARNMIITNGIYHIN